MAVWVMTSWRRWTKSLPPTMLMESMTSWDSGTMVSQASGAMPGLALRTRPFGA